MKSCQPITHKQKTILYLDLTGSNQDQILALLDEAQGMIAKLPPKSVLILTNTKDTTYNTTVSNAIKDFSNKNTPFVKASAVIGAEGLRKVLLQAVCMLTKREIHAFDTQEKAMDWLIAQESST
jgi:hypothetical protein